MTGADVPISAKDTEDLDDGALARETTATAVKNVIFKSQESSLWLPGSLTDLCSYFHS